MWQDFEGAFIGTSLLIGAAGFQGVARFRGNAVLLYTCTKRKLFNSHSQTQTIESCYPPRQTNHVALDINLKYMQANQVAQGDNFQFSLLA